MAPCPVQVAAAFVGVGRRKRDILLAFGQAGPDLIPALFTQEKCRAAFHNFQDPEKSFSDLFIFLGQDNPDFCPGSIMPVFHAGGCRTAFFVPPGLFFPADHPDTRLLLDIRSGHPAGAQNSGRVGQQIQNRGFQTDLGRPPVNDIGDAAGKIVQDMPGPGRTGSAGQVGRRGHNGNPRSQKQRTCRRLSRETDGHCFQPPRHQGGKSRMPGHDKGQRAGRKSLVEGLKNRRNVRDDPFQVVCGQKMDNKGVVGRPALEPKNIQDGLGQEGRCPQSVHRLGRKGHNCSLPENPARLQEIPVIPGRFDKYDLGFHKLASVSCFGRPPHARPPAGHPRFHRFRRPESAPVYRGSGRSGDR